MATDSTVAGFIAPTSVPAYDDALDDLLQASIAGITGLPGNLVRPRLQAEPASQPSATTDWVAVGVTDTDHDWADYQGRVPAGDGAQRSQRDETFEIMISCFGPNASRTSAIIRAGLQVDQNRLVLQQAGLEFVEHRRELRVPALIKNIYVKRIDSVLVMRRRSEFLYPILNLQSATFGVVTDSGISSTTTVTNP